MADVRSMLRSERTSRRITHPFASYTKSGLLTCSLCDLPVKSEVKWDAHLRSVQHTERERAKESTNNASSRKRKAEEDVEHEPKKTRQAVSRNEANQSDQDVVETLDARESQEHTVQADERASTPDISNDYSIADTAGVEQPESISLNPVNEDEWAAFETDIQSLEKQESQNAANPLAAYAAAASYEAAPMTAAELETANSQRGQRDAELENDREEAARQMEEEFGEMEELEERVKRLKERRQAIRRQSISNEQSSANIEDQDRPPEGNLEQSDDEPSEDDEDDDTFWRLRNS